MKRSFTLIELLAVIIILAIIALIATPIVLNIIRDSKENARGYVSEATLISYKQLEDLGCIGGSSYSCVYYTSYWSGSVARGTIWPVFSNGKFITNINGTIEVLCNRNNYFGIRPVVNISVNEI